MLVLSRRQNEQIVFPELGICVEIIRVQGKKVKIGISAPDSIRIHRGELLQDDRKQEQPTEVPVRQTPPPSSRFKVLDHRRNLVPPRCTTELAVFHP